MKKIFTLLVLSTAMLSTAFAQYGQRDRDKSVDVYVYNDNGYNHDNDFGKGYDKDLGRGAYIFTEREKDMAIAQINREYGFKIQSVKSRFGMSWFQKKRMINNLEDQREDEIRMVMHKFNSPKNKFGDFGRRNGRRW
ncbi:MAG TPA: hypothetical protein VHL77_02355 [Ferruginibacter sp.]|jgi:hypothetical protein|nr:hypothetical protein [Ferruginibacter sp.]